MHLQYYRALHMTRRNKRYISWPQMKNLFIHSHDLLIGSLDLVNHGYVLQMSKSWLNSWTHDIFSPPCHVQGSKKIAFISHLTVTWTCFVRLICNRVWSCVFVRRYIKSVQRRNLPMFVSIRGPWRRDIKGNKSHYLSILGLSLQLQTQ